MAKPHRQALVAGLGTILLHFMVYRAWFPLDRQFLKYPQAARQFLDGVLPSERLLDLSPLYFAVHLAQGALAPASTSQVVALQLLMTGLSAALLYLLLHRYFPPILAIVGTVAFAGSRSVVIYTCTLEPEAFLLCFLLGFLFFVQYERFSVRFLAGVCLALCLLTRPSFLPIVVLIPLVLRAQLGRRCWLAPSLILLTPALLAVLFLVGRNAAAAGTFSPVVMNPGFVFFEGNNPLSSGKSAVYPPLVGELKTELADQPDNPHMTYRLVANREAGRDIGTAAANAYWRQKAFNYLVDYPGEWLAVLGTKMQMLFHDFRRHDTLTAFLFEQKLYQGWLPTFPFALLSSLALLGMAVGLRFWRSWLLFYAVMTSQILLMLVMYVSERQRLLLLPLFIFFACAALQYLREEARWRIPVLASCVLLTLFLLLPGDLMREETHLWQRYEASDQFWLRALAARDAGAQVEAARLAAQSFAAAPWLRDYTRPAYIDFGSRGFAQQALDLLPADDASFSARFDRGVLLLEAGRLDEAEAIFVTLRDEECHFDRGYLQSSQPAYYRAGIALRRGNLEGAKELLLHALAAAPGDPFVLARLAALSGEERYRLRLIRYFSEADASFLLGRAHLEMGHGVAALTELQRLTRLLPELFRGKMYLAAALGASGATSQAAESFMAATVNRVDPAMLETMILPIFATAAQQDPGNALVRYRHGLVLAQYGYFRLALDEIRAAYILEPAPVIRETMEKLEALQRPADGS